MAKLIYDKDPATDPAAGAALQEALAQIPAWPGSDKTLADYAQHVMPIKRSSKQKDTWRPYVGVDGRVTMWAHAHLDQDPPDEQIVMAEVKGKHLVIQMRMTSKRFGTREDIATADTTASGFSVDATNPWENAVTSARGRVIGSFGFGLIPSQGIASAEEVQEGERRREQAEQAAAKPPKAAPKPAATAPAQTAPAAEPSGAPAEQPEAAAPAEATTETPPNDELTGVGKARKVAMEKKMRRMGLDAEGMASVIEAFATEHGLTGPYTSWEGKWYSQLFASLG